MFEKITVKNYLKNKNNTPLPVLPIPSYKPPRSTPPPPASIYTKKDLRASPAEFLRQKAKVDL